MNVIWRDQYTPSEGWAVVLFAMNTAGVYFTSKTRSEIMQMILSFDID